MADSSSSTAKIPLPAFLKILTSNNVPASKAMAVASKIYKTYNTPSLLGQLTDLQLKAAGVDDKEVRKLVLAALRKSGYKGKAAQASITTTSSAQSTPSAAGPSTPPGSSRAETQRPRKKRKRDDDLNEFFPDRPLDEGEMYGSLEFNEILDEEVCVALGSRAGRQPTLHVWSLYRLPACSIDCDFSVRVSNTRLVGCVRYSGTQDKVHGSEPSPYNDGMGVRRGRKAGLPARRSPQHRYCISICAQPRCCAICIAAHIRPPASVYTEMNAVTKGASLGIFDETRKKGMEASQSGSQPYVDLMGRRSVK
ncbi:hypothetical protein AcV7_003360 [Taiwanofungus camphoratus]|nr:hypothetical protein AcV7_003360 [Antrodia cinnamomea]